MFWSLDALPDLAGSTILVTGANSGIGLEAARMFARRGARVVLACRSLDKGREALASLTGGPHELLRLDLADLASVRAAATEVRDRIGRLHVLVNNAGVMALPRATTADGFEMQFGTNHLGHFALTGLLLDQIEDHGRVVTVSSGVHWFGRLDFDDLMGERHYDKWRAYFQAKLANMTFALELARRLRDAARPIASVACHPGYASTNLQGVGPRQEGSAFGVAMFKVGNFLFAQSATAGAWPTVEAAVGARVKNGEVYGPMFFGFGPPRRDGVNPAARDGAAAERLWKVSEELTGVRFL